MTDKQARFCEEYMIDLNATQAAIRAGYSPKTAQEQSARLLSNVMVQNRLAQLQAEQSRRTGVSADRVVRELAKIAFANASDLIDPETASVKLDASRDDLAAIQSIKVKSFGEDGLEHEVKLADKLRALDLLGKHLGMYKDASEKEKCRCSKITTYRPLRICCNGLFQTAISRTLKNEHSGSIF